MQHSTADFQPFAHALLARLKWQASHIKESLDQPATYGQGWVSACRNLCAIHCLNVIINGMLQS